MSTSPSSMTISYNSLEDYPNMGLSKLLSYSSSVKLWQEGCWVDGKRNCTAMCTNADLIWGNTKDIDLNVTANVGNCINYLILSNIMEAAGANSSVEIRNLDYAEEHYGIMNASQVDLSPINSSVSSCMQAYCKDGERCFSAQWMTWKSAAFNLTLPYYPTICANVNVSINPDIAGIGVLSAYLIAALILLIVYFALRTSRNLLQYVSIPYFYLRTHEMETAMNSAKELQLLTLLSHHVTILVSSLAEFQKGQCIFWLAIDAAVLVALGGSKQTLGARTLASFSANLSALKTICLAALVFVTFGLYCLHTARKRSWYITSLSLTTSIFSVIAYIMTRIAKPNKVAPDAHTPSTPGCGWIDPTTYCDFYNTNSYYYRFLIWLRSRELYLTMFVFAGLVSLGLLVDTIVHNTKFAERRPGSKTENEMPRWRPVLASTTRCLVELSFLVFIGFLFTDLMMIYYAGGGKGSGANTWGFGQIISLTIWIPVLLEWVYATTRGLENASDHRIAAPYKLIRTDAKMRNRIGWDHTKFDPADLTNTNGYATQLNDLSRRRTDIEHRLSNDLALQNASLPEEVEHHSPDDKGPLLKRKPVPAPITMYVPDQDDTHTSGVDFTPVRRTSTMTQRGEHVTERSVL